MESEEGGGWSGFGKWGKMGSLVDFSFLSLQVSKVFSYSILSSGQDHATLSSTQHEGSYVVSAIRN